MAILIEEWAKVCHEMSDTDLIRAMAEYKNRGTYFPTPAAILQIHRELSPNAVPVFVPLEEWDKDAVHHNAVNRLMANRNRTTPEQRKYFFALHSWAEKDEYAREVLGSDYPQSPLLSYDTATESISTSMGVTARRMQ